LARDILMALAIKCVHNLLPHLSHVSTVPDITQKTKTCCFPLSSVSGWITVGVRSDVPLPLHMHAAVFASGQLVCRSRREKYGPKCQ